MKELIDTSIESLVINILENGPISATRIIETIQKSRPKTPKQSVYLALRKLRKKEIVAISGKVVSLHQTWLNMMQTFFARAGEQSNAGGVGSILNLEEGEYVNYKFNSLLSLDMFWAHAFALLLKHRTKGQEALLYNPHQWFLIARNKSETELIKESGVRGITWLQLIGNATKLDREIRKYFKSDSARCQFLEEPLYSENYYFNCFGEFLIEVWIDKGTAEDIGDIYNKHQAITNQVTETLEEIIKRKGGTHKMRISRNSNKSSKIRSLFKKYFLI